MYRCKPLFVWLAGSGQSGNYSQQAAALDIKLVIAGNDAGSQFKIPSMLSLTWRRIPYFLKGFSWQQLKETLFSRWLGWVARLRNRSETEQ